MAGKRPRQVSPPRGAETSQHQEEKINVTIIANMLQCYACWGPLAPPLFQCTKGHISCSECCPDGYLDDEVGCLMCREPETVTRCRGMENVLTGLQVPCPFQQHGCTEMIPYASEQAHKASCVHAPCHCPISGCAGYAGKTLREHVQQEHPDVDRAIISPDSLTALWMRKHEQARVVRLQDGDGNGGGDDGAEFLLVVGQYKQVGRALSVVHLVDESMDKQDFKFKIEVVGKAGALSMSGETPNAERLSEPYKASPFLFIPNEVWDSVEHYFCVLIGFR